MRLTRFLDDQGRAHHGIDRGDGTAESLAHDPLTGPIEPTGRVHAIARRLAPVQPVNLFCIGLNYAAHAAESGLGLPEHPPLFMKPTTALAHPGQPIVLPACSQRAEVDFEAELAVVIGRTARNVSADDALDFVLGYTCANDVSARWWQKHGGGGQWIRGKSFDSFCPLGPVLVTAGEAQDSIADPQNLQVSSILNGQVMQDKLTGDMIFPVRELIARLSCDTTLLPGTVILTGTPEGVGVARDPQVFLSDGDHITIRIEGIGDLSNPVALAASSS